MGNVMGVGANSGMDGMGGMGGMGGVGVGANTKGDLLGRFNNGSWSAIRWETWDARFRGAKRLKTISKVQKDA